MRVTVRPCLNALILTLTLALCSCGGGSDTSSGGGSGGGGSGNGGAGPTTVAGNVSWVVAPASQTGDAALGPNLVAAAAYYLSTPANAQAALDGIQVIGGGQQTTTDAGGNFNLEDVTPGDTFNLTFELDDNQPVVLHIGLVPEGSRVTVTDIVLNFDLGTAQAEDKEIEEGAGGSSG